MPAQDIVQARLINVISRAPDRIMTRRALINSCGRTYRAQADEQISLLLSNGTFVLMGLGIKGSPKTIMLNRVNPDRCPLCHRPY
jgi:hypothetical protein